MSKKSKLEPDNLVTTPDTEENSPTLNHMPESPRKTSPLPRAVQKNQQACIGAQAEETKAFSIPAYLDRWIRQRGRDVCWRQVDRQAAVKLVNSFVQDLQTFLKNNEEQPFFRDVSVFTSGSYYELVKIHKPNEFDIMLKLKTPSTRIVWTELEEYKGLFYTLSFNRPTRAEIRSFLLEDERTISASRVISEMHRLVKKFVKDYKASGKLNVRKLAFSDIHRFWTSKGIAEVFLTMHQDKTLTVLNNDLNYVFLGWMKCRDHIRVPYVLGGSWKVCAKRVNSPAVTLVFMEKDAEAETLSVDIVPTLEVLQGWPPAARPGPVIDEWLGKIARRKFVSQPVYFVPKRPKKQKLSSVEKESWRISFSHIEKEMIRFHGNKKTCCESKKNECCRKLCLRLLKCLFEGLKLRFPRELHHLCSYHGKTVFFHNLSVRTQDSLWTPGQLSQCFMNLLGHLECAAKTASLPHFFVPQYNLFSPSAFPRHSLQFLTNALKEQRESGLPLLKVSSPAPALCHTPAKQLQPEQIINTPQIHYTEAFSSMACMVLIVAIGFVIGCALFV